MALKVLELTSTGDLKLDGLSKPTSLLGASAIEALVVGVLSLWKGDWFRNLNRGVNWLGILKKLYNRATIVSILTKALLQLPEIDEVTDVFINVDSETRIAQITYLVVADGERVTGTETI